MNKNSYYDKGGVSVLDIWKSKMTPEEFKGLCKGNVIKYICRAGIKETSKELDDLKKAKDYLNWWIETLEQDVKKEVK